MFSLTINFGPSGSAWALLFKTEEKAGEAYNAYVDYKVTPTRASDTLIGSDDFGQSYAIPFEDIHGMMLEDLDLVEGARIARSLVEERVKAKFIEAAKSDPTLRQAMQQRPGVLTPGMR